MKIFWKFLIVMLLTMRFGMAEENAPPAEEPPKEYFSIEQPVSDEDTHQLYYDFFKMIIMLSVIIAFLLVLMWFLKRFTQARIEQLNTSRLIKIIEQRNLSTKSTLYLIDVWGRQVLIAESSHGVTTLAKEEER